MYDHFAVFGYTHGAEQDTITLRAEQTARIAHTVREWLRKRTARRELRRTGQHSVDYTTAA